MAMIRGMDVILINQTQIGKDDFGNPIMEEVEEVVKNVLVAPASTDDVTSALDLYGKKAVYTLGIPKGDQHDWVDCKVRFFGETWQSFGYPLEGIERMIPLEWNKKVMVERYG